MYKVAGYITFYQDSRSLADCVRSLRGQTYPVQHLVIVDNSPEPLLQDYSREESITVLSCPENIGISGGLKLGLQWAIEHQYDFIWTFDQDSQPASDTLEKLVEIYDSIESRSNLGIIAPLPVDKTTGQEWHGIDFDGYRFRESKNHQGADNYYACDSVITSGSLISISVAKQIPFPDENFFIDAVDWEYCWKFRERGYNIIVAKNVILAHRFGNSEQLKIFPFPKLITIYHYSPLRYYYIHRNYTYLETRLARTNHLLFRSVIRRLYFLLVLTAKIALFERRSTIVKLWACLRGTYDGFRGKLGKTWQ